MDQDGTWHGGGPRSRPRCVRWGPSYPPQNRDRAPNFRGQTPGCIKMPLCMEVGLSPGDCLMGTQLPPEKRPQPLTQFLAHVYCGQTAGWIKMPLRMEVNLGPGDVVRWCRRSLPLKGAQPPVFVPCLLWPNGWMDEDDTWYGSRPRPRPHCVRRGPSSPRERCTAAPLFSAHVCCGHSRPSH